MESLATACGFPFPLHYSLKDIDHLVRITFLLWDYCETEFGLSHWSGDQIINCNNRKGIQVSSYSKKNVFKYIGGIKYGKKEGFGIQKWNDNSKYVGTFNSDLVDGCGKFRNKEGISTHGN